MEYRIVEENSLFYPQYRSLFIWHYMCENSYDSTTIVFRKSLEEAQSFLDEFRTTVKKITHEYP